MDITRVCVTIEAQLCSARGSGEVDRLLREHSDLREYPTHHAVLRALRSRSPAGRDKQARVVRALLCGFQDGHQQVAGALLVLAYQPMLCAFAKTVRSRTLGADRGERHELVLTSFFEAASRMPTAKADAPFVINLAMKTKQTALRELARKRRHALEHAWAPVPDDMFTTRMNPEVHFQVREARQALLSCESGISLLREANSFVGFDDARTMSAVLRAKHPSLNDRQLRRLDQRMRQRRSRLAAGVRRDTAEVLSQIRGYVDLVVQEDTNAWI